MKWMLILQFPAQNVDDYDKMIALEDVLIAKLPRSVEVDGHDFGAGQMNIFLFTDKPEIVFEKSKTLVEAVGLMNGFAAAYRLVEGDELIRLWPVGAVEPFRVI